MALTDKALRRYFAGLMMVRKDAFKSNALELRQIFKSQLVKDSRFIMGDRFLSLNIPKLFCTTQDDNEDARFLKKHNIAVYHFKTPSHWIAQACPEQFCDVLIEFIDKL